MGPQAEGSDWAKEGREESVWDGEGGWVEQEKRLGPKLYPEGHLKGQGAEGVSLSLSGLPLCLTQCLTHRRCSTGSSCVNE